MKISPHFQKALFNIGIGVSALALVSCGSTSPSTEVVQKSATSTNDLSLRGALRLVEDPILRNCLAKAAKNEKVRRKSKVRKVDCSGKGPVFTADAAKENDRGVTSLKGIENFRGITSLKLSYNANLKDISAIEKLPLTELIIKHTGITNDALETIGNLTNLRKLDLEYSFNINDGRLVTKHLKKLKKLRNINLRAMGSKRWEAKRFPQLNDGVVNDISFLANMPKLHTVNLSGNRIKRGLTAFYNTPLIANLTMVNVVYGKEVDFSAYKSFDRNLLRNVFLQSNKTAPCEQLLDIIQHYAPTGKSAQLIDSFDNGFFYLDNKQPKSFIKISAPCMPS